jgi:hypothetical protein
MQNPAIVVLALSCTLAGVNREPQAAAFSDSRNVGFRQPTLRLPRQSLRRRAGP